MQTSLVSAAAWIWMITILMAYLAQFRDMAPAILAVLGLR